MMKMKMKMKYVSMIAWSMLPAKNSDDCCNDDADADGLNAIQERVSECFVIIIAK